MPAADPVLRRLSATNAAQKRWKSPNSDETAATLAEARLSAFIARVVAEAPPLSAESRARLAALLHTPESGGPA